MFIQVYLESFCFELLASKKGQTYRQDILRDTHKLLSGLSLVCCSRSPTRLGLLKKICTPRAPYATCKFNALEKRLDVQEEQHVSLLAYFFQTLLSFLVWIPALQTLATVQDAYHFKSQSNQINDILIALENRLDVIEEQHVSTSIYYFPYLN
jgi:hypothetical protein